MMFLKDEIDSSPSEPSSYCVCIHTFRCIFRPVYPEEAQDEETVIDDDAELTLNKMEEEADEEPDDEEFEEEENILGLDDLKKLTKTNVSVALV